MHNWNILSFWVFFHVFDHFGSIFGSFQCLCSENKFLLKAPKRRFSISSEKMFLLKFHKKFLLKAPERSFSNRSAKKFLLKSSTKKLKMTSLNSGFLHSPHFQLNLSDLISPLTNFPTKFSHLHGRLHL